MAANLGTATIQLNLDQSQFKSALASIPTSLGSAVGQAERAAVTGLGNAGKAGGKALTDGFEQSTKGIGGKLQQIFSLKNLSDLNGAFQILKDIQNLAGGIAAPVFNFKNLSDFDAASRKASTLTTDIAGLEKGAASLAKELGNSTTAAKILDSSYDVLSSGFSKSADVLNILKAAQIGAVGGFSDVNTVANATTSVINAYGLAAKDATSIVQKMSGTQNAGKLTIDEYANNIGKLASTAAAAGVSLDEVNGIIANATAKGVRVTSAFDGLRQAIASVLKPSDEASKLAASLGINFDAAALKSGGIIGIFKQLGDRATPENLVKLFGSVEAVAAIMPSAGKGLQDYSKALDVIAKTDAMDAFTKVSGGIAFQTEALQNKLIDFDAAIKKGLIGESLAMGFKVAGDAINGMIGFLEGLQKKYEALDGPSKETVKTIGAITFGVTAAAIGIGGMAVAVGVLSGAFTTGMIAMGVFSKGLLALTLAAAPWVLAIAGVGLAVYGLYRAFGGSATSIGGFIRDIGQGLTRFKYIVVGVFDAAIKWIGSTSKAFADMVAGFVRDRPMLEAILKGMAAPFKFVYDVGVWAFNGLIDACKNMANVIGGIFAGIGQGVKDLANSINEALGTFIRPGDGLNFQIGQVGGKGAVGVSGKVSSPFPGVSIPELVNRPLLPVETMSALRDRGKRVHNKEDLAAPAGTPVLASYSGTATIQKWQGNYGAAVTIRFQDEKGRRIEVTDGHLNLQSIINATGRRPGETFQVTAGQKIGEVHDMGADFLRRNGIRNHVDRQVLVNGVPVSPRKHLMETYQAAMAQAANSGTTRTGAAGAGALLNASTYHPGGGGVNGPTKDIRGRQLLPSDFVVATPLAGRPGGLPYGTRVRVTNPENNRSVEAIARDGGPYAPGRQLDVTTAVRNAIGFRGLGKLKLEIVGLPKGADANATYYTGEATKFGDVASVARGSGQALSMARNAPMTTAGTLPQSRPYVGTPPPKMGTEPGTLGPAMVGNLLGNDYRQIANKMAQSVSYTLRKADAELKYAQADYDRQVAVIAKLKATPTGRNPKLIAANNAKIASAETTLENRRRNLLSKKEAYQKALEGEEQRRKDEVEKALARDTAPIQQQIGLITAYTTTQITGIDRRVASKEITPEQGERLKNEELAKQARLLDQLQPKIEKLWEKYQGQPEALTTLAGMIDTIQKQGAAAAIAADTLAKLPIAAIRKRMDELQGKRQRYDSITDVAVATGEMTELQGRAEKSTRLAQMQREFETLLPYATELMDRFKDPESQSSLLGIIKSIQDIRLEAIRTQKEVSLEQIKKLVAGPQESGAEREAQIRNQRTAGLIDEKAEQLRLLQIREETNAELLKSIPAIEAFQQAARDEDSIKAAKDLLATIRAYNAETIKARNEAGLLPVKDIKNQIEQTLAAASDEQQIVKNERLLGIIKSQREEEERLLAIRLKTADFLDLLIPKLEALRDAQTDPKIRAELSQQILSIRTYSAEATGASLASAKARLEESLGYQVRQQSIEAAQTGLRDIVKDATRGFQNLGSILDSLINKIADIGIDALLGGFASGDKGGTGLLGTIGALFGFSDGGPIKNYAAGGAITGALNLASAYSKAMQEEGPGAVPIVAKVGEEVLNLRRAKIYRSMLKDGTWSNLERIYNYASAGTITANGARQTPTASMAFAGGASSNQRSQSIVVDRINQVDYVSLEQLQGILEVTMPEVRQAAVNDIDNKFRNPGQRNRWGIR